MGAEVEAFEGELAAAHGRRHAIMVNSGSSANLVAVAALCAKEERPLKPGHEAVVPAIAWATTYAPLVQHGFGLRVADVGNDWNVDLGSRWYNPGEANLVVACSVLGFPADLEGHKTVAGVLGGYLLEDNCESFWAVTPQGRLCGTYGDVSTTSFFWSHQLAAIEGGAILTDDHELSALCRMLRDHGATRGVLKPERFEDEYDFRLFGYNVRPLEMHAAVAREQLRKQDQQRAARITNMQQWRELVTSDRVLHPEYVGTPNPFGLHFALATQELRGRAVAALRGAGIDCRLPTGGSFLRHAYAASWGQQDTPHADAVHRTGLFIGNPPWEAPELIEKTAATLLNALQ